MLVSGHGGVVVTGRRDEYQGVVRIGQLVNLLQETREQAEQAMAEAAAVEKAEQDHAEAALAADAIQQHAEVPPAAQEVSQ
jgi:hypothetical protein